MNKSSTGVYYYNYDTIQSSATYGRYKVKVVSTSGSSQVGIYMSEFFVMPWKIEKDVRQITGASETKDIDDDDLADLCWKSYQEALRDTNMHHYSVAPNCNPDTGEGFNGTNTTFKAPYHPIADINGDGYATGNNVSCATDIKAWWINNNGSRRHAVVTVSNSANGEINIYQNDGTSAIPSDNEGVYLDYWSEYRSYDQDMFRDAVAHLAADRLIRRLKEVDRVTLGDLASNIPIITKDDNRFYRKYKQIINRVRKPAVSGV